MSNFRKFFPLDLTKKKNKLNHTPNDSKSIFSPPNTNFPCAFFNLLNNEPENEKLIKRRKNVKMNAAK